jgi:hypothetical protein
MDTNYQRELLAFEEKIALAELEQSKAAERVNELKYQRARFNLDFFIASVREQEKAVPDAPKAQPQGK